MKTQLIIAALPFMMSHGCVFGTEGSGKPAVETRNVATFIGIDLQCSANVYFSQGEEQSVKVEAEDNIIPHITTEVRNNELIVSTDGKDFKANQPVNVYVTVKELCMLELTGSGNMIGKTHISCDDMTIHISGSGDIRADVRSLGIKMKLSGSGNLEISGTTTSSDIRIAGSGNVNAKDLQCLTSAVTISGSGQSTIQATEQLSVSISGSGDVHYIGDPAKLNTSITGSGTVSKI